MLTIAQARDLLRKSLDGFHPHLGHPLYFAMMNRPVGRRDWFWPYYSSGEYLGPEPPIVLERGRIVEQFLTPTEARERCGQFFGEEEGLDHFRRLGGLVSRTIHDILPLLGRTPDQPWLDRGLDEFGSIMVSVNAGEFKRHWAHQAWAVLVHDAHAEEDRRAEKYLRCSAWGTNTYNPRDDGHDVVDVDIEGRGGADVVESWGHTSALRTDVFTASIFAINRLVTLMESRRAPADSSIQDHVDKEALLTPCQKDILKTLRESKRRLTTSGVLEALENEGRVHGESTVKQALADMHNHLELLSNCQKCRPNGYGLREWPHRGHKPDGTGGGTDL